MKSLNLVVGNLGYRSSSFSCCPLGRQFCKRMFPQSFYGRVKAKDATYLEADYDVCNSPDGWELLFLDLRGSLWGSHDAHYSEHSSPNTRLPPPVAFGVSAVQAHLIDFMGKLFNACSVVILAFTFVNIRSQMPQLIHSSGQASCVFCHLIQSPSREGGGVKKQ